MSQKLIMSACFIHEPKVIFVDEPMVGLDPKSIRLVKDIFKEKARQGTTIFMSTHTLDLAQDICSHIAIINIGRLIALGTMEDLTKLGGSEELEDVFLLLTRPELQDNNPIDTKNNLTTKTRKHEK
jgi:ABC-2 type transport system ATP-binding protein